MKPALAHAIDEQQLHGFLQRIYDTFHYDFRDYSRASLHRRLSSALNKLGFGELHELEQLLEREPHHFTWLLQLLTVQVSELFRDPLFFAFFRAQIVPELRTYPSLKIWVAGCATGEEVFSLAILLREERLLEQTLIYATDVNPEALRKAQAGVYALDRLAMFTENHRKAGGVGSLSDHYTAGFDAAVFDRSLLRRVVFSDHSLATDSVFSELHVVLCRNVLIYFNRELQSRAAALFRDSLCRRGFLGLGDKESLRFTSCAASFRLLAPGQKWYQRW